jgi:2'-hydroxyisoflavone reductase
METLVLSGTSFVGRAIVTQALSRGDDVSLFSRGRTGTALFPDVPRLVGDRDSGELAALAGSTGPRPVDRLGDRGTRSQADRSERTRPGAVVGDAPRRGIQIAPRAVESMQEARHGSDSVWPAHAAECH